MGTAKVELADDSAAYFSDMARRYQSLAAAEQHQAQSDLFATIAADYAELAETAPTAPYSLAAMGPTDPGSLARWMAWVGRGRRPAAAPAAPLTLPVGPTPAD